MTTFDTHLSQLLRGNPGRPLVTFYDHASGERTELSVTTYANWVAKTASLLAEELDLERGQRLRIDLPPHWLGTVALGAAWTLGLAVTEDPDPDAVLCGPDTMSAWAARADDLVVIASALHPMATRFVDGVPPGVHDLGVEVWSQPDAFTPWDPPTSEDPATDELTQGQLWDAASGQSRLQRGDRVLSEENPASPSGFPSFTEPLVGEGSLILVAHAEPERLEATYATERATARFPWS